MHARMLSLEPDQSGTRSVAPPAGPGDPRRRHAAAKRNRSGPPDRKGLARGEAPVPDDAGRPVLSPRSPARGRLRWPRSGRPRPCAARCGTACPPPGREGQNRRVPSRTNHAYRTGRTPPPNCPAAPCVWDWSDNEPRRADAPFLPEPRRTRARFACRHDVPPQPAPPRMMASRAPASGAPPSNTTRPSCRRTPSWRHKSGRSTITA